MSSLFITQHRELNLFYLFSSHVVDTIHWSYCVILQIKYFYVYFSATMEHPS